MFAWFPVIALIIAGAALLWRVPVAVVRQYFAAFASRHGIAMQLGVTVLATIMLGIVVASLAEPGRRPVMEFVDAAVVVGGLAVAALDLYLFCRGPRAARR